MLKSVDICGNTTVQAGIVSLHSPEYPNQYPASLDCRCEIQAGKKASLMVNFQVMTFLFHSNTTDCTFTSSFKTLNTKHPKQVFPCTSGHCLGYARQFVQ